MPLILAKQLHVWNGTDRTWQPSDGLAYDVANGWMGIGIASPSYPLHIVDTSASQYSVLIDTTKSNNDSFRSYALRVQTVYNGHATGLPVNYAIYGQVSNGTAGNCGNLTGVRGASIANGAGDIQQMVGLGTACGVNYLAGTVQVHPISSFSSIALDVDTLEMGGASVNMNGGITAGIRILTPFDNTGGAVITGFALTGLYIQDMYSSIGSWSLAKPWNIFSAGGTNFFGGNVTLFNSDPGFNTERGTFFIGNASTPPTSPFASGATLYAAGGALVSLSTFKNKRVSVNGGGDVTYQIFESDAKTAADAQSAVFQSLDSGNNSTEYGRISCVILDPTNTTEDSYFTWKTQVAGTETEIFRAGYNGFFGIGETAPTATLQVKGTVIFKSASNAATSFQFQESGAAIALDVDTSNRRVGIATSAPDARLSINAPSGDLLTSYRLADTTNAYIGVSSGTNGVIGGSVSGDMCFRIVGTNGFLWSINNGTSVQMRLGSSGGLQMGAPTGGDKGAGTANFAADIYKNNAAYTNPAWVFEHFYTGLIKKNADKFGAQDYKGLPALEDTESFCRENHELPQMARFKDGGMFDRGDMLLASLEQAFLYIFQQNKRIAELERNLNAV